MTEVVEPTAVEIVQAVTPSPEPVGPRTLVICMGAEPASLYPFGEEQDYAILVNNAFAEGNWGAYDTNSYTYQPIILEKLPSLADGDATLTVVTVTEGDTVVDAGSNVVKLDPAADPAIMLIPVGGGDPLPYQGGDIEMEQLSATFTMLPDLLWSDGTLMTAADSIYAFKLLADPDTPRSNFTINRTFSYEAIDDLTTMWTGLPGYLDSSYHINFFGPAPEHAWGEYTVTELLTAEQRINKAMMKVKSDHAFSDEQERWLELIRRHLLQNLLMEKEDIDSMPIFFQEGASWGKLNKIFGGDLEAIIHEINTSVAA